MKRIFRWLFKAQIKELDMRIEELDMRIKDVDKKQSNLKKGDKVLYIPMHRIPEKGIVKRVDGNGAFVVYNCRGNWDDYEDYTAAKTNFRDLVLGWPE